MEAVVGMEGKDLWSCIRRPLVGRSLSFSSVTGFLWKKDLFYKILIASIN